jgi:anaerobic selenocysteine-containing dehydrogenase
VEDWYVLWSLAATLGLQLRLRGQHIPMSEPPNTEDLLRVQLGAARVPIDEVIARGAGSLYPVDRVYVAPRENQARFQLVPADVAQELDQLASELCQPLPQELLGESEFQMIVRRHREWMNSTAADFEATRERIPLNPAYFNPADLNRLGLAPGASVELVRGAARITVTAAIDEGVRLGVVSVGHCRSGSDTNPYEATNALIDSERDLQAINRMPMMTGVKVTVVAA